MPDLTPRQQAEQIVDGWVRAGTIPQADRDRYIQTLAADDKVANAFAGGFMRHGAFTQKTQEFAETKRREMEAVERERQKVLEEANRLRQWETKTTSEIQRLQQIEAQLHQKEAELAAYRQAATDYGIESVVSKPAPSAQQIPSPQQFTAPSAQGQQMPQSNGNGAYLGREEAASYIRELVTMQGNALKIAAEHHRLFGHPLEDDILTESMQAQQDPRQYWETKYNVASKRAEIAEAQRIRERADIEAQVRAQVMSEIAANPQNVLGVAPALGVADKSLVFDTYVKNRITDLKQVHSPTTATGDGQGATSPMGTPPRVVPEQIPPMAAQYSRITDAASDFNQNFSVDGKPLPGSKYGGG